MTKTAAAAPSLSMRQRILAALAVAAVALAVYLPSLRCDFINLDDPQYVTYNPYIIYPSWKKLGLFFSEVWHPTTVAGYYQPLTMASLMLDRVVDDHLPPRPVVFHFTNILLHAVNAALLVAWLTQILAAAGLDARQRLAGAVIGGLAFALHPVNVEAVSWVCQRKALLSQTFTLLALIAYHRFAQRRSPARHALVIAAFILSLLAKPTGALLPLLLIALDYWPYRRLRAATIIEKVPLLALMALGSWIAFESQRVSMGRAKFTAADQPAAAALVLCHNIAFYLGKMAWPMNLSPQYPMPEPADIHLRNPVFLIGVVVTVLLGLLLFVAALRSWRRLLVGLGAFYLLLLPASGVVDFMGAIAADRFLYLPMLPLLLLLAATAPLWPRWAILACALALAPRGAKTLLQQAVWKDSFTYYAAALNYAPEEPGLIYGLANAHYERWGSVDPARRGNQADFDKARMLLTQVIEKRPAFSMAYFRLGELCIEQGDPQTALDLSDIGLQQPAADAEGFFIRGRALSMLRRPAEAIEAYENHLARRPAHRESLRNLGNALCQVGRWRDAEQRYLQLIEIDPADGEAFYGLGRVRLELYGEARAIPAYEIARDRKPGDGQVRLTLAACYAAAGRLDEARRELTEAIRLRPDLFAAAERQKRFEPLRGTPFWEQLRGMAARGGGAP